MASTTTHPAVAIAEQTAAAKPAADPKVETAEEYRRRRAGIASFL